MNYNETLPRVFWKHENIRIVIRTPAYAGETRIFDVEKRQTDALGEDAWTPLFCVSVRNRDEPVTDAESLLWHLLNLASRDTIRIANGEAKSYKDFPLASERTT